MSLHASDAAPSYRPWPALWALVIGFFMIMIDTTIVSVATPDIMHGLHADVEQVVWVTSAYLLSYAVPVLITGRLGDRFGPKTLYMVGLTVFTASSAWCGFTSSIQMLIAARAVQGLGAAMMTPQTMSVITRIFPADRRGRAMSLWGATAGVAALVGPILGGVLVAALGWEWIFFINVPIGVVGLAVAWRLVPTLETHRHRFDWAGVALSAVGLFCLVFGIQEGEAYNWGAITGIISVWGLIGVGAGLLVVFVVYQAFNRGEPLVPLAIFKDRNFSLANIAITTIGFAITAMSIPLMLWAQDVRDLSPIRSGLLLVPMAVLSGGLAPFVGRLADRRPPRLLVGFGIACFIASLVWMWRAMTPDDPIWHVLLPAALLGVANGFMWAPLGSTATRNLPLHQAGAGSGIYNTTRQFGAVLGSAGIAVLMSSRLAALLPAAGGHSSPSTAGVSGHLPDVLKPGFSQAMGESLLLPAAVLVVGLVAAMMFVLPRHLAHGASEPESKEPVTATV